MSQKRILIISLSNLGDAILTYPTLQGLWDAFPKSEFHVLASARTQELFEGDPRIHRVWVWEKEAPVFQQARMIGQLFFLRFHLVVDFRNSLTPLFLLGARRTPLFRKTLGNPLHRVEQHLKLLQTLGVPMPQGASSWMRPPAALPYGPKEEQWVSSTIQSGRPVIVMAPGARSHLKRWAPERFAAVADRLILEQQAQIFLVGDGLEQEISHQVRSAMREQVLDLTGRTSLRQTFALLNKARMVITNDSACLHAADAMGVATVAIFGPTDEKKYGPRLPQSRVIRRQLVCAPCERALCPYGHECMRGLEADEVYEAAVKVLTNT